MLPLCDPSLYADFLREFESGEISDEFRRRCAVEGVPQDEQVRRDDRRTSSAEGGDLTLDLTKFQDLRYGENPQQPRPSTFRPARPFEQLQGKELSYNNLLDLDAAMRLANAFGEPAAAVIKHTNPCGVARRESLAEALRAAIESDPVSAFGGIIGANRDFDADCAQCRRRRSSSK